MTNNDAELSVYLTEEEKNLKFTEATLFQIQKIYNRQDIETMCVQVFFPNFETVSVMTDTLSNYQHNILQYNMVEFFEKIKGLKKIKEISVKDSTSVVQAKKTQLQYDKDKFVEIYENAYVFYENVDGSIRICIKIDKEYYGNGKYLYEVYTDGISSVFKEWQDFSKSNNFYKNKKIYADGEFLDLDNNISWNDLILPEEIITVLKNNIKNVFETSELLKKNGISLKRGIILTGLPGCVLPETKIKIKKISKEGNHKIIEYK